MYILDASVGGIRVAHQASLPPPGGFCRLEVATDVGTIKLDCEVVRTVAERTLYHSGLEVVAADHQSLERLKTICAGDSLKR